MASVVNSWLSSQESSTDPSIVGTTETFLDNNSVVLVPGSAIHFLPLSRKVTMNHKHIVQSYFKLYSLTFVTYWTPAVSDINTKGTCKPTVPAGTFP
jgi:hypothetical protein